MANPDWMPKWMKWTINRLDDPFDDFKHYWHGLEIEWFGQWYKCSAYMANKPGTSWSIRKISMPSSDANRHLRIGWHGLSNKL
jgi:hypothetical protein